MALRREKVRSPEELVREGDRLMSGADGNQSYEEAFNLYRKAAGKEYLPAMYRVGCMYESGHGVQQSYRDAFKWYVRAADMGDRDSRAAVAFLYESGLGVKPSRPLALENLEYAANAGCRRAMNNLGLFHQDRQSAEFSDHASVVWFQKANLLDFPPATANLARMYETGKGVVRNCSTASNLFRKAAKAGNLPAKVFLADMLKYGIGIDMNQSAAAHLYTEAARWGDPLAIAEINGEDVDMEGFTLRPGDDSNPRVQLNYGLMFLFGIRAPYAPETAFYLLESSAEAGCTDAMYVLGQAFDLGIGYDRSRMMAKKWYSWGADKGHGPCAYELGWFARDENDIPSAISYFKKAVDADQDDDARADALDALAGTVFGDGSDESAVEEALGYYVRAAGLGHPRSQLRAGRILLSRGDVENARTYLRMAADQGDDAAKSILESIE